MRGEKRLTRRVRPRRLKGGGHVGPEADLTIYEEPDRPDEQIRHAHHEIDAVVVRTRQASLVDVLCVGRVGDRILTHRTPEAHARSGSQDEDGEQQHDSEPTHGSTP